MHPNYHKIKHILFKGGITYMHLNERYFCQYIEALIKTKISTNKDQGNGTAFITERKTNI